MANTVFDARNEQYVSDLLRDGNVLYTRNGENILDLMGQQREVLKRSIEDVSTDNMPQKEKYVKTESAKKKQLSLKSQVQKDAVAHFGKTYSWDETGYVLTDGTKLDFSGRHEGGPGGYRSVDHREVVDAFGEDSDLSGNGAMVQFMADGAIRIMPESGGINLSVEPTAEAVFNGSSSKKTHVGWVCGFLPDGDVLVMEERGLSYGFVVTRMSKRAWKYRGLMTRRYSYGEAAQQPEAAPGAYVFTRLLKYGRKGDDVVELKKLLIAAGYSAGITINTGSSRNFYSSTRAAVKQYQRDNGLTVDGIAGRNTIRALGGIWEG